MTPLPRYDTPAKSVKEVLERADALLADETRWTKGTSARTASGLETGVRSPMTCQVCIVGAIRRAGSNPNADIVMHAWRQLEIQGVIPELSEFNDAPSTTFADIKALLAKAINEVSQ